MQSFIGPGLRELSFFSSRGGGGGGELVETGEGSSKNTCQRRGIKDFSSTASKKKGTSTSDAALELLCISSVLTRVTFLLLLLKNFQKHKKSFKIQIVRQILTHFLKENIATFLDKSKIVNFHMIYLFTPAFRQICNSCLQIPRFTKSFVS